MNDAVAKWSKSVANILVALRLNRSVQRKFESNKPPVSIKRMTQWRSGLTLRFAKPPFAGSTPACVSSNRRFTEVTLTQEQVSRFTCAGSRSAQRYLFSKTNRERRPARNFFDEKSLLVGDSHLVLVICPGDGMVDIEDLKSSADYGVRVRVPPWAQI